MRYAVLETYLLLFKHIFAEEGVSLSKKKRKTFRLILIDLMTIKEMKKSESMTRIFWLQAKIDSFRNKN